MSGGSALRVGAATIVSGAIVHADLTATEPLGALCARLAGERYTAEGRAAARRWLGVRRWLRAQESFADLPSATSRSTAWLLAISVHGLRTRQTDRDAGRGGNPAA